jgi:probable rRNA maturation factor
VIILRKPVPGLNEDSLARFVRKAARESGLSGVVNVLVTTSHELRMLNRRFCKKDKATDVLSFSPEPLGNGYLAGDVAISADIAARNARRLRHSTVEEVKILALHGVLHLAGYDHQNDSGEMERIEHRLRRKLKLPDGLIERQSRRPANGRSRPR